MKYFDVFNGDADGICALHQLRLAKPLDAELITGVKRDIQLLRRVSIGSGDRVTVLDVSLDKNRDDLLRILNAGASVHYVDHHFSGEIPADPNLDAHINTAADTCTSLLVNETLHSQYLAWAVTAAFGDNLFAAARKAAIPLAMNASALDGLQQLGTLINYNGYGVSLDDLHIAPDALYRSILPFDDPLSFIAESPIYHMLKQGFAEDMAQARVRTPELEDTHIMLMHLPDQAWARRVSGVLGNELARSAPERAHALLTTLADGTYRISVRAPVSHPANADTLCMQFSGGGGRKAAAGINALPVDQLDHFIDAFKAMYSA